MVAKPGCFALPNERPAHQMVSRNASPGADRAPGYTDLWRDLFSVVAIFAGSAAAFAPVILDDRVLANIDLLTHYRWLMQYQNALSEGTWYPRWMPLMNLGLGEWFVGAYPLYYQFASILMITGFSAWASMKALAVGSAFFAGTIAYFGLKQSVGAWAGLLAGLFVVLSPLPVFLFTHHSALPWQFSLALAIALLIRSVVPLRRGHHFWLAVTVTLLILSHALVAYMALLSIGTVLLMEAVVAGRGSLACLVRSWLIPVGIGVGLASFHLLPALASLGLRPTLAPDDAMFSRYLNWQNSFAFPTWTEARWGMRWFTIQWPLAVLALLGVVAASWVLWRARNATTELWTATARLTAIAVVALFFASELAYPLYASLEAFRSVQWPYRFVSIGAASSALSLALAASLCARSRTHRRSCALIVAAAVGAMLTLTAALDIQLIEEGKAPELSPSLLEGEFAQFNAEIGALGPRWREYATNGGFAAQCQRSGATCRTLLYKGEHRSWSITVGRPVEMVFPVFAFPVWTTRIDHRDVPYVADPDTGLVAIAIPAGTHDVEIELTGLRPWDAIGGGISVVSLIGLVAVSLWLPRRNRSDRHASAD